MAEAKKELVLADHMPPGTCVALATDRVAIGDGLLPDGTRAADLLPDRRRHDTTARCTVEGCRAIGSISCFMGSVVSGSSKGACVRNGES